MHMRVGNCGRYYHTARYLGPLPSNRAFQTFSPVSVTLQHFAAGRRILSVAAPSAFLHFPATVSPAILHSAEAVTAMQAAAPQVHGAPHAAPQATPRAGRQLLSVAPMMDWTDTHYRQLARIISRRTWLWTEMVSLPPARRRSTRLSYTVSHPRAVTPFLDLTSPPHPPPGLSPRWLTRPSCTHRTWSASSGSRRSSTPSCARWEGPARKLDGGEKSTFMYTIVRGATPSHFLPPPPLNVAPAPLSRSTHLLSPPIMRPAGRQ